MKRVLQEKKGAIFVGGDSNIAELVINTHNTDNTATMQANSGKMTSKVKREIEVFL